MLKRIIALILIFSVIRAFVFAEGTTEQSYRMTVNFDTHEITMEEQSIKGETDYSSLMVDVIKYTKGIQTLIYTGPLSGYDNGAWVNTNFDTAAYLMILDWATMDDEAIYIVPYVNRSNELSLEQNKENSAISSIMTELESETDEVYPLSIENNVSAVTSELQMDAHFKKNGQMLLSTLSIKNKTVNAEPVQVACAVYNDGKLLNIVIDTCTIYSWGEWNLQQNIILPEDVGDVSVKLMVWNAESKTPYGNAIELNDKHNNIENEIYLNVPTNVLANKYYLFRPMNNSIYNFGGSTNLKLYKKAFGTLTQIELNSLLIYPNQYYIVPAEAATITICKTDGYLTENSFNTNDYYSDMSDGGSIYKSQSKLYEFTSRWLNGSSNIYFNSNGLKYINTATDEIIELITGINPYYIVSEENDIYYADWRHAGMIYKYELESESPTLVCKDRAAWLRLDEEYVYYRNLIDEGKLYRIEKTAINAEQGQLVDE